MLYESLTNCDLVTPHGDIEFGPYWLRKLLVGGRHQAITRINADFSLVKFCGIHKALHSKVLFRIKSLKCTFEITASPPKGNELRTWYKYLNHVMLLYVIPHATVQNIEFRGLW